MQATSTTEASAFEEVNYTLSAIKTLYDDLDFPGSLSIEKSIQAGKSAPNNLIPLGPVLISPSPSCPLSSTLVPLAAAVAAGSCCLILLPSSLQGTGKIRDIIRESLDQEAIGVAIFDGLRAFEQSAEQLRVEAAVLQGLATRDAVSAILLNVNPDTRIFCPSAGLPAVFVDHSVGNLRAVASFIYHRAVKSPRQNTGRVPRLCFVDEFLIEELKRLIEGYGSGPTSSSADSTNSEMIANALSEVFPSLNQENLNHNNGLPNLVMVDRNECVLPTITFDLF